MRSPGEIRVKMRMRRCCSRSNSSVSVGLYEQQQFPRRFAPLDDKREWMERPASEWASRETFLDVDLVAIA
jgi:hypothetical protein